MHFTPLLCLAPLLVSAVAAKGHNGRHGHARRSTCGRKSVSASTSSASASPILANANAQGGKGKSTSASFAASSTGSAASSSSTGSSSSSSKFAALNNCAHKVAGICVGFLPDDGSGGGDSQSLPQLASAIGADSISTQGWYAQTHANSVFDGSQLLSRMDAIVKNGGIFQPAIMPTGSWWGYTEDNNVQAVAIAKVLKQFTDQGVEVWLRFAHEVNWYQVDGTYVGDADDFKTGWAQVAKAVKQICPDVKMWFTPNVAELSTYQKYFPDDVSTVDIIGVDYYPQQQGGASDFIAKMQPFHDAYTHADLIFAIGETGLGNSDDIPSQLAWMKAIASDEVASAMPHMKAVSWFNYKKEQDFRIAGKNGDYVTKSWLNGSS